jgi:1,2-diacylglycerol 3-alpha-glucosyltransferase
VVALDAPGAREVVEDHHNGRLLNEMDHQSFVDALFGILSSSPKELLSIKQAARMTAQKYQINSVAKRMLKIYEHLRTKKSISLGKKNSSQYLILWRMEAEWDIYRNYIKSAAASVFKGNFNQTEPIEIRDTTASEK